MEELTALCEDMVESLDGVLACAIADGTVGRAVAFSAPRASVLDEEGVDLVCGAVSEMFLGRLIRRFRQTLGSDDPAAAGFVREVQVTTASTHQFIAAVPGAWDRLLVLVTDRSTGIGEGWMAVRQGLAELAEMDHVWEGYEPRPSPEPQAAAESRARAPERARAAPGDAAPDDVAREDVAREERWRPAAEAPRSPETPPRSPETPRVPEPRIEAPPPPVPQMPPVSEMPPLSHTPQRPETRQAPDPQPFPAPPVPEPQPVFAEARAAAPEPKTSEGPASAEPPRAEAPAAEPPKVEPPAAEPPRVAAPVAAASPQPRVPVGGRSSFFRPAPSRPARKAPQPQPEPDVPAEPAEKRRGFRTVALRKNEVKQPRGPRGNMFERS